MVAAFTGASELATTVALPKVTIAVLQIGVRRDMFGILIKDKRTNITRDNTANSNLA